MKEPMMLMRCLLWYCSLLICASPVWAGTDAPTAESLMRKSGMWEQLEQIAPQVRAGIVAGTGRSGRRSTEAESERLSRAIDHAYAAHRLRVACRAAISKNLDSTHVEALRRWYDSGSGRHISSLERAQSTRDGQAALRRGTVLLEEMPASRRRALEELVVVSRSAELQTELTIGTALAVHHGAASVSPEAARPSLSEVKAMLEKQRHGMTRTFSALSLAAFAAAYASLSAAELDAYVEFLKSHAGRHYTSVTMRAFATAMLDAAAELGRAVPGSKDKAHT
jgi:hypothetical protein